MLLARRFTAILVGLALVACRPTRLHPFSALHVALHTSARVFTVGDSITLIADVHNRRSDSVTVPFTSTCQFSFLVEELGTDRVIPDGWGCGQLMTSQAFAPHESRLNRITFFTDSMPGAQPERRRLGPGKYRASYIVVPSLRLSSYVYFEVRPGAT